MVPIPIPEVLTDAGARYILIKNGRKEPAENDWDEHTYEAKDERLLQHLKNGGNYGIVSSSGICCIDIDDMVAFRDLGVDLPKSLWIHRELKTYHYYFLCKNVPDGVERKKYAWDKDWGDVRLGGNFFTVGPNCIAPNKDKPPRQVRYEIMGTENPLAIVDWLVIEKIIRISNERKAMFEEPVLNTPIELVPTPKPVQMTAELHHEDLRKYVGNQVRIKVPLVAIQAACSAMNEAGLFDRKRLPKELEREVDDAWDWHKRRQLKDKKPVVEKPQPTTELLKIFNYDSVHVATDECIKHMLKLNETTPTYFIRDRHLTLVSQVNGFTVLETITEPLMQALCDRMFYVYDKKDTGAEYQVRFPPNFTKDILAYKVGYEFPNIREIQEMPIMRIDGSITTGPGYDSEHEMWISSDVKPVVPETPTMEQVNIAIDRVRGLLEDFPFDTPADKSNAFAMMVSAATQFMYTPKASDKGLIYPRNPLFIISKNTYGAGASLLTEMVGIIRLGCSPPMISPIAQEEEIKKVITTEVQKGSATMIFDNWDGLFDSKQIISAITIPVWSGRLLGKSIDITLPFRPFLMLNGNNVEFGAGDSARRAVVIYLNSEDERPADRNPKNFKYPYLIEHVIEHRTEIIEALFTIARYWVQHKEEYPAVCSDMGSFSEWRRLVGGIMALVDGNEQLFLSNKATVMEEMDAESGDWSEFMERFVKHFDFKLDHITNGDVDNFLRGTLGTEPNMMNQQHKLMSKNARKVLTLDDGRRIRIVRKTVKNVRGWRVEFVKAQQKL